MGHAETGLALAPVHESSCCDPGMHAGNWDLRVGVGLILSRH